ncbi:EamA family transporter [Parabacteroides sp. PF5-9]|uniref:EamA family transporter n=1 Tax=Parabacteroides sp. PF5-9 TaxID=1742404 RepID=UPI00247336A4|nr:EamA family transporter [Parabacteroides sp. PF5-9]MDH6358894.1 drug/metabolite transporter (DMT)-like permease [Parabacteroides sp. PF5-9]
MGRWKLNILFAYFLIYVVWGSTYYFISVALRGLPPFLLGAFRFTAAGLILLIWCYFRGEPVFKKSLIKKSAVSGIVLLFIDMAVIMLAQRYVSSSLVAIIASSTAIWIMAFDIPMWKRNFRSVSVIAGLVMGFLGVMMLYAEQFRIDSLTGEHREYGVLLLFFGCISWALGTLYTKYRSSGEEEVNAFAGSAWQMFFASAMFWICAFFNGDMVNTDLQAVPVVSWLSLAYLIVFGSIMAYSAYIWLLKVRPATEVGTHAYVNPFVAVFLGMTLGKEEVTWIQIMGLIVILLSVMLISREKNSDELVSK